MSKKILTGKVVSAKMKNTVVVAVEMPKLHRVYKKMVKYTKRIMAHDALGVKDGDIVQVRESKPFSKRVSWEIAQNLSIKPEEKK